ncbi:hypothetical protein Lser_V15G13832 [Lactuca serriola]
MNQMDFLFPNLNFFRFSDLNGIFHFKFVDHVNETFC